MTSQHHPKSNNHSKVRDGFVFAFVIELMQPCISIHYSYSSVVCSFSYLLNLRPVSTSVEGFSRLMLNNSPSLSTKITNHPQTYGTTAMLSLGIHRVRWSLGMQWKPDWRIGVYDVNRKFQGCIAALLILPMSTYTGLLTVVYMSLHPTSRGQNHPLLARGLPLGAAASIRASSLLHIDKINLAFTLVTLPHTAAF